jgi:uncharacterized phiE125 gp8 family phage protein
VTARTLQQSLIDANVLTREQLEAHVNFLCHDDRDKEFMNTCLEAATDYAESYTRLAINKTLFTVVGDSFPTFTGDEVLYLPHPPLQSIEYVKYYDTAGDLQTWTGYNTVRTANKAGIYPNSDEGEYPDTESENLQPVEIRYVAGMQGYITIPPRLLLGIRQLAAHYWKYRNAATDIRLLDVPFNVRNIFQTFRLVNEP